MMRILVIVLALAGCGSDENVADMALPQCPPNAGQSHGARCRPGVDSLCTCGPGCYMAHCQCDGWWETDAIQVCCDADGGASHCSP